MKMETLYVHHLGVVGTHNGAPIRLLNVGPTPMRPDRNIKGESARTVAVFGPLAMSIELGDPIEVEAPTIRDWVA